MANKENNCKSKYGHFDCEKENGHDGGHEAFNGTTWTDQTKGAWVGDRKIFKPLYVKDLNRLRVGR